MKKTKKALLALGTFSAVAAPVMAVVSCASIGHEKDTGPINVNGVFNGITLRVGTRMDERAALEPALHEFSLTTGAKIKYEGAQPSTYDTTAASASGIADVTLVEGEDTNVKSQAGGWFEPFKLKGEDRDHNKVGLLDNPTYNNIQYGHGYELNKNLDLEDNATTDTATFRSAKWKVGRNKGQMNYLPAVFGPRLIYGWKHDKNGADMFDGSHDLKWFVPLGITAQRNPNDAANGYEEVDFSSTPATDNPLLKPDGTHYKNTYEDIKEFLMNSARESNRKFNQTNYDYSSLTSADARKRLIATGQEGYKQRLYSVVKTLKDAGYNLGDVGILEYSSIDIAMMANGMSSILRTSDSNKVAYNGDMVDDAKWAIWDGTTPPANSGNLWDLRSAVNPSHGVPDAWIKLWLGQFGYLNNRVAGIKQLIRESTESIPFSKHRTSFFNGQKWLQPELLSVSHTPKNQIENTFVSFPQPFSDPGVDGYAVKSGLTGKKRDAAFALLRFLMQEKVQAEMSGEKTLPIIKSAKVRKMNSAGATMFDKTAASNGFDSIPAQDRLSNANDIVTRTSTHSVLNQLSIKAEKNTWNEATSPMLTWQNFVTRMNDIAASWRSDMATNG